MAANFGLTTGSALGPVDSASRRTGRVLNPQK